MRNLDPGGFSLLLHEWMTVSQQPAWLRALPLAWFLASLAAMGGLAWTWRRSPVFAVAGATVPLAYPLLVYQATELRLQHGARRDRNRVLAAPPSPGGGGTTLLCARRPHARGVHELPLQLRDLRGRGRSRAQAGAAPRSRRSRAPPRAGGAARRRRPRRRPARCGPSATASRTRGGVHIEYLSVATAAGKSPGWLLRAAIRNLLAPAALPVTLAALVALVPARVRARRAARSSASGPRRKRGSCTVWRPACSCSRRRCGGGTRGR